MIDWFDEAIVQLPVRETVHMGEAQIETLQWGTPGKPGLLLIHGFAAHAGWWSFIAPMLTAGRHVVAISLTGMGRSSWRERYSVSGYAAELEAVAAHFGFFDHAEPPILIAHSFGGFPSMTTAARHGKRWGGLMLVDTMIDDAFRADRIVPERRPRRFWPDRNALLARFRLLPDQACANGRITDYIAETSIEHVEGEGWSWLTDPNAHADFEGRAMEPVLGSLACPVAIVTGDRSALMSPERLAISRAAAPPNTLMVGIPDAAHHILLDQPLALISVLRTLLRLWQPDV